jgi:predicted Na+-dependent transporter
MAGPGDAVAPNAENGAFIAMGALIVFVVFDHAGSFVSDLRHTVPLAIAFVVVSFAVGWLVGSVSRGSAADRFTIATEFATRNIAVATAIAVTLLAAWTSPCLRPRTF